MSRVLGTQSPAERVSSYGLGRHRAGPGRRERSKGEEKGEKGERRKKEREKGEGRRERKREGEEITLFRLRYPLMPCGWESR